MKCICFILSQAWIDIYDTYGTGFINACSHGNFDVVQWISETGGFVLLQETYKTDL
jgi:hypothetical protein